MLHILADDGFSRKPDDVLCCLDFPEQLNVVPGPEWWLSRSHLEQDGPDGPQVGLGIVPLVAKNLGGHVQRRAAESLGERGRREHAGKPEIGQLEHRERGQAGGRGEGVVAGAENLLHHLVGFPPLRRGQQEQVLGLDVAVDEVRPAQELEGTGELLQEVARDHLVQARVRGDGVFACELVGGRVCDELVSLPDEQRQIPQLAVLHDEVDMGPRLDAVVEGNDVGMAEPLEDLDLAVEIFL